MIQLFEGYAFRRVGEIELKSCTEAAVPIDKLKSDTMSYHRLYWHSGMIMCHD